MKQNMFVNLLEHKKVIKEGVLGIYAQTFTSINDLKSSNIQNILKSFPLKTRITTFIKTKFNKSDDQTNIDKYRVPANITEYHIILSIFSCSIFSCAHSSYK